MRDWDSRRASWSRATPASMDESAASHSMNARLARMCHVTGEDEICGGTNTARVTFYHWRGIRRTLSTGFRATQSTAMRESRQPERSWAFLGRSTVLKGLVLFAHQSLVREADSDEHDADAK